MKKTTGCAAVAALVTLVGCADDAEDDVAADDVATSTQVPVTTVSPTAEESPEPIANGDEEEVDVDEAIEGYVEGVASARPSVGSEGLEYAAPDSVAYAYLQHRVNLFDAALDGGLEYDDQTVEAIKDGYEMCDPVNVTECSEFTEFETVDEKVVDFLVDGTSPGPRLAVGDGSVVDSEGVSAEFLTAYRAITNETLFVTVRIDTGEERAELNTYSATYRAPEGEQRQAAEAVGPFEIGAESTATIALAFPEAEPGGTVTLDGYLGDDFANTVEFTIQTG